MHQWLLFADGPGLDYFVNMANSKHLSKVIPKIEEMDKSLSATDFHGDGLKGMLKFMIIFRGMMTFLWLIAKWTIYTYFSKIYNIWLSNECKWCGIGALIVAIIRLCGNKWCYRGRYNFLFVYFVFAITYNILNFVYVISV